MNAPNSATYDRAAEYVHMFLFCSTLGHRLSMYLSISSMYLGIFYSIHSFFHLEMLDYKHMYAYYCVYATHITALEYLLPRA